MLLCVGFCVGCADKLMDVEVWYCSVKIRQLEQSAEQVVLCSQPAVGKLGGEVHRPNPTSVLYRRILVVAFFFFGSLRHLPHRFIENVVRPVH